MHICVRLNRTACEHLMNADYEAANHLAPSNGKAYPTAHAWKFNCLFFV